MVYGVLALFVSVTIALMAIGAHKFLNLPSFLLLIPFWAAMAIFLAARLLSERIRPRPFVFAIGSLWLAFGLLPLVWAEFFA
jgi:hypothetical protein